MRRELEIGDELLLFHSSNLRSVKRVDLLLEAIARIRPRTSFKLLMLAGDDFTPFECDVDRLGLRNRLIVRTKVSEIEDYLQAADLGVFTSQLESFGLSILEGMYYGCPSVAMQVGGIPELIEHDVNGMLSPFGDVDAFARTVEQLLDDRERQVALGESAKRWPWNGSPPR